MWTRKELKDKAKVSFKANYWKSVFVALVLVALVGGLSMVASVQHVPIAAPFAATSSHAPDNVNVDIHDGKVKVDVDDEKGGKVHVSMNSDDIEELREIVDDIDEESIAHSAVFWPGMALVGFSLFLAVLVAAAFAIALYVFVLSPLEVGAQRFFIRNLNQRAEVKEVAFAYDNNYKETVKSLFLRSLFIFLWSLLLVVPGIYKAYEYRMIPYLLADDPTMTKDRAFSESRRLMDGQKWNAFVLDLSFLGWNILSALTAGILGVFYVTPYQVQTNAALYEKLRYGLPPAEQPQQAAPVAPVNAPAAQAQAQAQAQAAPVIVSESQPPVPPFAQVGAVPESPASATASATAPLPEDATGATAPLSEGAAGTTAPLPQPGIDPTIPLPENLDGEKPNSTEA